MKKLENITANQIFLGYAVFIMIVTFVMVYLLGYKQTFFLNDDGYLKITTSILSGGSIFYQFRPPLLPLLFVPVSFAPDEFEGFFRVFFTLCFVFINTQIARRIFKEYLIPKYFNFGLLIALFNPLHIHFTLKSTPEIYIASFLGLLIIVAIKFFKTGNPKQFVLLLALLFFASNIKPVFALVSIPLVVYSISYVKQYFVGTLIILIFSVGIQLTVMEYSQSPNKQRHEYGTADLIAPYFLPEAMFETGRFEFGSHQELMQNSPEESNLAIAMSKYSAWYTEFRQKDSTAHLARMVLDFISENPGKVLLAKVLAPIFFVSLASSSLETFSNLFINVFLIIFSSLGIKNIWNVHKQQLLVFLSVLVGYFLTYFIAFSYARYSLPVIFYLSFFASYPIVTVYKSFHTKLLASK